MIGFRGLFAPPPPEAGAGQVAQWRGVRSLQLRQLAVFVPLLTVVGIIGLPPVLLAAAGLAVIVGVGYAVFLTLKIRRAERPTP
jgi:hypothetical protein